MKRTITMRKLLLTASLMGMMLLTACSNDSEDVVSKKIEVTDEQFSLIFEDFTEDQGVTRAAAPMAAAAVETVDMGDGMLADVCLVQDTDAPQTRAAKPLGDGHYTMYAIDTATGSKVTGPNSKVSGTVSGGKFTKDAGMRLELAPGTYTFVCFNDAVTETATGLETVPGGDALIGTATKTVDANGLKVKLMMKRQMARMRFKVVAYTPQMDGVKGKVTSDGTQPVKATYSMDATTVSMTTGTVTIPNYEVATSGTADATYVLANAYMSGYSYYLPATAGNDLKFEFTDGTTYGGVSLAGKSIKLSSTLGALAKGHSYTVQIKLRPAIYLFQDGTNGVWAERGSRTPIGIVLGEKTNTADGTAMALKNVIFNLVNRSNGPIWSSVNGQHNNVMIADYNTAITDMDGYKYTWEGAGSIDGVTVKANKETDYPSFYHAAHWGEKIAADGIAVSGPMVGRKWYLPSIGEWYLLVTAFRHSTPSVGTGWGNTDAKFNMASLNNALTQAGGHRINDYNNGGIDGYYWASTEIDATNGGSMTIQSDSFGADSFTYKTYGENCTRAFVHF